MYIRGGKEVHMILKSFWMQLQIHMRDFLGHLKVSININIKPSSYIDEINK